MAVNVSGRRLAEIKNLGVQIAMTTSAPDTRPSPTCSASRRRPEDRPIVHLGLRRNQEGEIETFAEGIEQQQELSLLKDENCDSGQGFLFARPLDVAATERFPQDWTGKTAATPAPASQSLSPDRD